MDQETRNKLQRATQQIRRFLEEEFAEQLEGTFDILQTGRILPNPGKHLDARQRLIRQKLVEAIEHIKAGGKKAKEAVEEYTREAAFTFLNRFVALRMLEARGMLQECVSKGDQSNGFKEFCGLAPGLTGLPDGGYRLYLECLLDELSVEVKVLFDRRDRVSSLWPRRPALTELLDILSQRDLATVWHEDETIGWVYQYFNSGEERKKMREASQAPRNSRELAVRNQFFTPRYVVEFLTDNTLGRIWYEMRKGDTRLVDECDYLVRRPSEVFLSEDQKPPVGDSDTQQDLSQEDLLKRTVYIPHRVKKDPRDLKILDPACGSGHFLLYAFDLLISIYEEGWHDEASAKSEVTGRRLRDDYPDLHQLHAALPGLVLGHNLHGIDIDPRAAQIAALALWMRGQRALNTFKIAREKRLPIARSNIVCAEPMPGETAFLDEFIDEHLSSSAEDWFLASLVRKVFESMKLAGEAGSLLKIEEEIAEEVAKAKKQWLERPGYRQQTLFDDGSGTVQKALDLTRGITDESFWEEAEQRIYDALRAYSEQAEKSGGFQRRLFAIDAAHGFAFIDLCRQRYDVAIMNPPFGWAPAKAKQYQDRVFPNSKNDLYCVFVERLLALLNHGGMLGSITSRTAFFLSSMRRWREDVLLQRSSVRYYADLGFGVLDSAFVETAAFVLESETPREALINFYRVNEAEDKAFTLLGLICSDRGFFLGSNDLRAIPGSPFSYWVSRDVRRLFLSRPNLEESGVVVAVGLATSDNERFVRTRWEVPAACRQWKPYPKGGDFARFHQDVYLYVNWDKNGNAIKAQVASRYGSASRFVQNQNLYFKPGLTYPRVSVKGFGVRAMPANCIFSDVGQGIFSEKIDHWVLLGLLNSEVFEFFMRTMTPSRKWEAGFLKRVPLPHMLPETCQAVSKCAERLYRATYSADLTDETTVAFLGLGLRGAKSLESWINERTAAVEKQLQDYAETTDRLNEIIRSSYGLSANAVKIATHGAEDSIDDAGIETELEEHCLPTDSAEDIASYLIGIAFGRWDLKVALDVDNRAVSHDPFAPVSIDSFAQLERVDDDEGRADEKHNYRPDTPPDGLLVDDDGHVMDIAERVGQTCQLIWPDGNTSFGWENYVAELCVFLGVRTFRDYIRKSNLFFSSHIKRYSKSRRKAPIYWQLATPSASYSVWLYYHRLTRDTFFKVLNEYIKPKVGHERQKLERLRGEAGAESSRSQRKEIEDHEKLVAELASMVEEVERIAPLWNPNLNDGVIINFAPLWRLVPQNKSWQRECKSFWDKLVKGDYDWAHLAMHLWPERVVPKCVTDASLAIAHGLENVFWEQDDRERFQPKDGPEGSWEPTIERLVKERSSPAVRAALQSLLDAPVPSSNSGRSRRRRTGS